MLYSKSLVASPYWVWQGLGSHLILLFLRDYSISCTFIIIYFKFFLFVCLKVYSEVRLIGFSKITILNKYIVNQLCLVYSISMLFPKVLSTLLMNNSLECKLCNDCYIIVNSECAITFVPSEHNIYNIHRKILNDVI